MIIDTPENNIPTLEFDEKIQEQINALTLLLEDSQPNSRQAKAPSLKSRKPRPISAKEITINKTVYVFDHPGQLYMDYAD